MAGSAAHAVVVFRHRFEGQGLKRQLAGMGFSQMKTRRPLTFHTPFAGQDDQECSVFLITGRT